MLTEICSLNILDYLTVLLQYLNLLSRDKFKRCGCVMAD